MEERRYRASANTMRMGPCLAHSDRLWAIADFCFWNVLGIHGHSHTLEGRANITMKHIGLSDSVVESCSDFISSKEPREYVQTRVVSEDLFVVEL